MNEDRFSIFPSQTVPVMEAREYGPTDDQILEKAKEIVFRRMSPKYEVTSPGQVFEYLQLHYALGERESFGVILLNAKNQILKAEELFFGTIDATAVYPREVADRALRNNAAAVVLFHNHPSGDATPSQADKRLTRAIEAALNTLDIKLLDHIIVAGGTCCSFMMQGVKDDQGLLCTAAKTNVGEIR